MKPPVSTPSASTPLSPMPLNTRTTPRTIVVKLGGAADVDHAAALRDIARLREDGDQVVVVHGGSAEADRLGRDVGHPARTLTSPDGHESRHTDPRTLELFVMATALVNRRIVGALQAAGTHALGLSGLDGALLRGQRKRALRSVENGRVRVIRDDWSGRIEAVDGALCQTLLAAGTTPVIAPVAMTADGEPLNVDGDRVAAAVAGAIGADELVLLTGANGLYRAFPDPSSRIECAVDADFDELLGYAQGRMKRKVIASKAALDAGVGRVLIASAAGASPIAAALEGAGTTLLRGALAEVAQ